MFRRFGSVIFLAMVACSQQPAVIDVEGRLPVPVIPQPTKVIESPGVLEIIRGSASSEISTEPDFLESYINAEFDPEIAGFIQRDFNDKLTIPGQYVLSVSADAITLTAMDETGQFYALQTLKQIIVEYPNGWKVPLVQIEDQPRFQWRGMHLDVSRHFFPAEFIKRYIDILAFHKLNVFHWHLTDDNGWRIEIEAYPKLTEISAWRVDREHQPWRERNPAEPGEAATYGGFYTKAEIQDVVDYAAQRHITVVPEIEMPGHTSEVFAAYPELSCRGVQLDVAPGSYWPNKDIFCAGNDTVFVFLETVLSEVAELFPGPYLHIGGDEAHKARWEECPKCQARIQAEGLADEAELQSWFIKRIEKYVVSLNKRMIGWDEILEGGLAPEATVMSWRNEKGGIAAARMGHDAIMSPNNELYFDHYQGPKETEPVAIGGYTPIREVYEYDPLPGELTAEEAVHILGAQANLWTEFVSTSDHAEYMLLPRIAALSEIVWTQPEHKDWKRFKQRLVHMVKRYEARGWNYRQLDKML